jgi:hypothetical protein
LWASARAAQDARLEHDPWEDELDDLEGDIVEGEERIFTLTVMKMLGRAEGKATSGDDVRLVAVMRRLGWEGPDRVRIKKQRKRGYYRAVRDQAFTLE